MWAFIFFILCLLFAFQSSARRVLQEEEERRKQLIFYEQQQKEKYYKQIIKKVDSLTDKFKQKKEAQILKTVQIAKKADLQEQLSLAIVTENYEEAAKVRDLLSKER